MPERERERESKGGGHTESKVESAAKRERGIL
jgi:hypothetical protein